MVCTTRMRQPITDTSGAVQATQGVAWKYWRDDGLADVADAALPASRSCAERSSSSSSGRRNSSSERARPSSRSASALAPIRTTGRLSSSVRHTSAWRSAWNTERGKSLSMSRNCTTRPASSAPR